MTTRVKKGQLRKWNDYTGITFLVMSRKTVRGIVRDDLGWGGRDRGVNMWTVLQEGEIYETSEIEIFHGSTSLTN